MAEQINQDITIPDDPPSSRDKVNFRLRADDFVAWMKVFATQMNSLIPKVNASLSWINTNVQNALSYSQTATAQAGVATTKAGEASASAAAALASKEAAEAIFDNFDDKYLGAKPTAPIVDNDGNPLTTGALYFKTTAPTGIYVYDAELSIWSSPTYVPTSHGSLSGLSDADAHPMSAITGLANSLALKANIVDIPHVSVPTAYHIYNGSLTLSTTAIMAGFATTLYTGNGSTQTITTGIDMSTQWGNDPSEKFGGLVWLKGRSIAVDNHLQDTINGTGIFIQSNSTGMGQATGGWDVSSFLNGGFSLSGTNTRSNQNGTTYASWNFQTTHRVTGITNHGKTYTEHYNPFTGFTIIQYVGSGNAGHEIPHSLGRKLGFVIQKDLIDTVDWLTYNGETGSYMSINTMAGKTSDSALNMWRDVTDISISLGIHTNLNENGKQHILYGWANSYFDAQNNLIGNYEIGVYQGSGVSGNTVRTRGKPAWVMIKRLDSSGNWGIFDNQRNDLYLYADVAQAETSVDLIDVASDGFILRSSSAWTNASGGQYLYMVVYDNDSGSGKSKYTKATDSSYLNLNALVPFAQGIDSKGTKGTILSKNETLNGLTITKGKNYVYAKSDGTYGVKPYAPQYNTYNGYGDYFDVNTNKWYQSPSVFACNFSDGSTAGWTVGTAGALSVVGGVLKLQHNGTNYPTVSKTFTGLIVGKKYTLKVDLSCSDGISTTPLLGFTGLSISQQVYGTGQHTVTGVATASYVNIQLMTQTTTSGVFATMDNLVLYPVNADGSVDLSGATEITESRNYLDAIVYADAGGQAIYVEQLSKVEYKDIINANEFQGKNACTAWASVDGTTTPIVINDSFNISSIIRISTGVFRLMYKKRLDNANVSLGGSTSGNTTQEPKIVASTRDYIDISVSLYNANAYNDKFCIQIFGGKE